MGCHVHHDFDPVKQGQRGGEHGVKLGKLTGKVLVENVVNASEMGWMPGGQGPHHGAHGIQVSGRTVVSPCAPDLLGGHVGGGSRNHFPEPGVQPLVGIHGMHEAKVGQLDPARASVDQHIPRLNVAVNHAARMGVGKGIENVHGDGLKLRPSESPGEIGQGAALDKLHGQPGQSGQCSVTARFFFGDHPVIEYSRDAFVVEARGGADLVAKGFDERRVTHDFRPHDLQSNPRLVALVLRQQHGGHAPFSEGTRDDKWTNVQTVLHV